MQVVDERVERGGREAPRQAGEDRQQRRARDRGRHDRQQDRDRQDRARVLEHHPRAGGDAAAVHGDGAHHRRGVRRVEHSRARAGDEQPEGGEGVRRRHGQRRHAGDADRRDHEAERGEPARAVAVRVAPGQRRADQHADRHRRELQTREDRVVADRALEVEDEQERQREPREPAEERGRRGRREPAVLEEREVEHRVARAALDDDEERQQHRGRHQRHDRQRVGPAHDAAARDAEREAGQADDERERAPPVEALLPLRRHELAQDERRPCRSEQAERQVEPEDPVPGDGDERAAEHRPDDEADGGDHDVRAHRQAELLARERVGDERRGVGEDQRRADALEDPPEDQARAAGREAGAQRRQREHEEAQDVGPLAPEDVGQAPERQHENGRRDHVREDHPDERQQLDSQRALQVRERDHERAGVHRREQHPEARARQCPPLVVLVPGVHTEPPARRHQRLRV